MYKISLFFAILGIFANLSFTEASVSKDVQKKNIIFEHFAGTKSALFPKTQRLARTLEEKYSGRFFPINVHHGIFASGTPDLTIDEGILIGHRANSSGWPVASINRMVEPWELLSGIWTEFASESSKQDAPVNIVTTASVDQTSRKLSVEVEYYYTSNSSKPSNYLTVVLTQSNIIAKQAGAEENSALLAPNDIDYRHAHVLRMVLSSGGTFGQEISPTTKGSTRTVKFEKILPASIKGVDLELDELNIAAFISQEETGSFILNGHGAPVENNDPNIFDLAVKNKTEIPNGFFVSELTPKITVTNNSNKTVNQFEVEYRYNGNIVKKKYNGNLGSGKSVDIEWDKIEVDAVGREFFEVGFISNIQPNVKESRYMNNFSTVAFETLKRKAFSSSLWTFEDAKYENMFKDISQNKEFRAQILNEKSVGVNNSKVAMVYHCKKELGVSGKSADLVFGGADLSKVNDAHLSYHYAYSAGGRNGTNPIMKLLVSENFGKSWKEMHSKTFDETGTTGPENVYVPKTTDYKLVDIDLKEYSNKENVSFKLRFIPGSDGINALIDDVKIGSSQSAGAIFSMNSVDFKKVELNQDSEIAKVKITNIGNAKLTISGIAIKGADKANFILSNNMIFPLTIDANTSKDLEFIFKPQKHGNLTAEAVINTNVGEYKIVLKGATVKSSVPEEVQQSLNFEVKPTIANNQVQISYNIIGNNLFNVNLTVYSQSGEALQTIHNEQLNGSQNEQFDVSSIANGIYFVCLNINGVVITKKIVVSK